ncbi:MAG TPA: glycosyltransferase family 2 protein [Candidatus Acidoferrum sp.]|nr:glycosyltransferase family 2 protein [Candidatus Acidoferrum sp.]
MQDRSRPPQVAVVIPCYKVIDHILGVIAGIGPECQRIYVVDDCCPDRSGDFVQQHCRDPRVKILRHDSNQGVGGAVMTGYRAALADHCDIVVKIDGDGQMDPALLPRFVAPIVDGTADYTKGNRFFHLDSLKVMPRARLIGNALLSLLTKLSTGYWNIFDPTNGYTAIHAKVLRELPLDKLSRRYFFESDLLFRLSILRAVVTDIPMHARYGDEVSNLRIGRIVGEFLRKHLRNFAKRVFYNYYLRDMSLASLQLPLGCALLSFSLLFGGYHWWLSWHSGVAAPTGTVILAALSLLLGVQFVLAFLAHDIAATPQRVLHTLLPDSEPPVSR